MFLQGFSQQKYRILDLQFLHQRRYLTITLGNAI